MASPPNFRISPGTPAGPTDLFLQIFADLFLITLVLIIKFSHELANFILLRSQQKTNVKYEFKMLALSLVSVMMVSCGL